MGIEIGTRYQLNLGTGKGEDWGGNKAKKKNSDQKENADSLIEESRMGIKASYTGGDLRGEGRPNKTDEKVNSSC